MLLEQAEVNFVGHVDQLRHDDLLILLVIDADERGVIAEINKTWVDFLFNGIS